MANYTFYYLFSIIAVVMTLWAILNAALLRIKGRTLYGQYYKPGSPEYKGVIKLAGNRVIFVLVVLELVFIANLVKTIYWVLALNTPDAIFLLIYAPVFVMIITVIIIFHQRSIYGHKEK